MKMIKSLLLAAAAALTLAACNVTIPNPFGGPPLVLTGNFNTDLPSISAYSAALKAGAKADVVKLQAFFAASCPYVASAQAQLPAAQAAAQNIMTASAAQKQVNNAAAALNVAQTVCNGGTATNLKAVFTAGVDAYELIYGLIKNGN